MTPANPLVAGPVDMSTPFGGTFLLEDGEALAQAISDGDWIAGGMAAFSAVMDTIAAVSDPIGTLIAMGLGWVMEHVEPLRGWLNDLTGDAGEVAGFAQTWSNVGAQLTASGDELTRVLTDLDGMEGATISAYAAFQADAVKHIRAAADWSSAMSTGLQLCSTIVKIVHDVVRDAISQVVGAVISYAAELVISLGLATPLIIEQVTTRVSSLVSRIGKTITDLVSSGKALKGLLDELGELLKRAKGLFDEVLHGKPKPVDGSPRTPSGAGSPRPRQTGGSDFLRDYLAREKWAKDAYDDIRSRDTDLTNIANHPSSMVLPNGHQLTPDELSQIKSHVFLEEHPLSDYEGGTYPSRFAPNAGMAEAWHRLENGTATDVDRLLLQHELAESNFMREHPGASYEEAHAAANAEANWQDAAPGQ
jgi:hypothetical protein